METSTELNNCIKNGTGNINKIVKNNSTLFLKTGVDYASLSANKEALLPSLDEGNKHFFGNSNSLSYIYNDQNNEIIVSCIWLNEALLVSAFNNKIDYTVKSKNFPALIISDISYSKNFNANLFNKIRKMSFSFGKSSSINRWLNNYDEGYNGKGFNTFQRGSINIPGNSGIGCSIEWNKNIEFFSSNTFDNSDATQININRTPITQGLFNNVLPYSTICGAKYNTKINNYIIEGLFHYTFNKHSNVNYINMNGLNLFISPSITPNAIQCFQDHISKNNKSTSITNNFGIQLSKNIDLINSCSISKLNIDNETKNLLRWKIGALVKKNCKLFCNQNCGIEYGLLCGTSTYLKNSFTSSYGSNSGTFIQADKIPYVYEVYLNVNICGFFVPIYFDYITKKQDTTAVNGTTSNVFTCGISAEKILAYSMNGKEFNILCN